MHKTRSGFEEQNYDYGKWEVVPGVGKTPMTCIKGIILQQNVQHGAL